MHLAILLLLAPLAFAQKIVPARAGLVYYAEGTLNVDGKIVRSSGQSRFPHLRDGQTVSSPRGHAEVLLGPEGTLWTGTGARVRFDDTRVEDTALTILEGPAIIEIKRTLSVNRIRVSLGDLGVEVSREGVYRFDTSAGSVRVYAGEALLTDGAKVTRGQEGGNAALKNFDRKDLDEFHYWSAYRSFALESEAGTHRQWDGSAWGEREHSGFGVKFPDTPSGARVYYQAASEAGLIYLVDGSSFVGSRTRNASTRLPLPLGRDNSLRTEKGRAELFLGVGIVARLGENSQLRMIDTRASNPVVALEDGAMLIEVARSANEVTPRIQVGETVTELLKAGLYYFDAKPGSLGVYGGEALTTVDGVFIRAKEGQKVSLLSPAKLSPFDTKAQDPLYKWTANRSYALYQTPAAFMTPWEPAPRGGRVKHKQFGERADTRARAKQRPRF